jgi:hypothetical protein
VPGVGIAPVILLSLFPPPPPPAVTTSVRGRFRLSHDTGTRPVRDDGGGAVDDELGATDQP